MTERSHLQHEYFFNNWTVRFLVLFAGVYCTSSV